LGVGNAGMGAGSALCLRSGARRNCRRWAGEKRDIPISKASDPGAGDLEVDVWVGTTRRWRWQTQTQTQTQAGKKKAGAWRAFPPLFIAVEF